MSDERDDEREAAKRRALGGEDTTRDPAPAADLAPGAVVREQFEITGTPLFGGMGVVYPARDLELDEACALKLMHPRLVSDAQAAQQFREEARNARRLRHEAAVQVWHFGDWAGRKFLVMEWVAGGSLRAELRRRAPAPGQRPRLPLPVALGLIGRVTDALAYAHAQRVIHLDVKPENILLDGDEPGNLLKAGEPGDLLKDGGRPKLTDFGISKLLGPEDLSHSAAAAGTAGYIAPERLNGAKPHAQMDVFSVGAMLYELICGQMPDMYPDLHEIDPDLPAELNEIVKRCLSGPKRRYETAAELSVALRALIEALGGRSTTGGAASGLTTARSQGAAAAPSAPARTASVIPAPAPLTPAPPTVTPRRPAAEPVSAAPRAPAPYAGPDRSEMIAIPAGEFWMGSDDTDKDAVDDEKPRHRVVLDAFEIDKHPVTNARWKTFMDAGGYRERRLWSDAGWQWREERKVTQPDSWTDTTTNAPEQPVVGVSWYEAEAFCAWAGKRLPTEAEWEKAARGTDGRRYPWGDEWDKTRANSLESGIGTTTPVGKYPTGASPYGVQDLAGNVWEWIADWYDENYYKQSPERNPKGPTEGIHHVLRGGSFNDGPIALRAADRGVSTPDDRGVDIGYRCARGPSPL